MNAVLDPAIALYYNNASIQTEENVALANMTDENVVAPVLARLPAEPAGYITAQPEQYRSNMVFVGEVAPKYELEARPEMFSQILKVDAELLPQEVAQDEVRRNEIKGRVDEAFAELERKDNFYDLAIRSELKGKIATILDYANRGLSMEKVRAMLEDQRDKDIMSGIDGSVWDGAMAELEEEQRIAQQLKTTGNVRSAEDDLMVRLTGQPVIDPSVEGGTTAIVERAALGEQDARDQFSELGMESGTSAMKAGAGLPPSYLSRSLVAGTQIRPSPTADASTQTQALMRAIAKPAGSVISGAGTPRSFFGGGGTAVSDPARDIANLADVTRGVGRPRFTPEERRVADTRALAKKLVGEAVGLAKTKVERVSKGQKARIRKAPFSPPSRLKGRR